MSETSIKKHFSPSGLMAPLFVVLALPVVYYISRHNYNLFHSVADGGSIVIAACAFTIIWNSRRSVDNNYFLYAGIAFLFFAFLDLLHVLGNKNMGVFSEYGNLGPAFYIASRYVLSISLIIAPLFINRKLNTTLMFAVYTLGTSLILLSVFYWRIFPVCIVEGVGLTPFKVVSDYIICLTLLGAIGLLLVNRQAFDDRVLWLIVSSLILSIATGLTFTLYSDPFGVTNMVGHLFQIASFYLVYLALIETSLTKPQEILFRKLKQNEEILTKNLRQLDTTNVELKQEMAERRRVETELRQSEAKYRNLFENMTEEVHFWELVRDEQGLIRTWRAVDANPPTLKTWGKTRENVVGKTTDEIFGPGATEHYMPIVQKIFTEETPHSFIDYFPNLDKYFRFTSVPLGEYFITTGTDITDIEKAHKEIRRLNVDLSAKNEKLEVANAELESFIYSVSHDLRAPLRHISGFADLVMQNTADKLDEKGKRYLSRIHAGTEKMSRLIDELLSLSRVSRQEIQRAEVDMSSLAESIVSDLREANSGRNVEVDIKRGLTVAADRGLIEVALSNLIGNAWKFTAKTEHARIELGSTQQDGKDIYYVRDNGAGFDQQYAGKMFWPFHRLHSESDFEGTGIGLAIVERIIRGHGGKVWAEGAEGKGATIYFSLN